MRTYITITCEHCKGTGKRIAFNHHALRQRRQYVGLSLRQLAGALGLSAPYLSDVERGNRPVTDRLVKAYGLQHLQVIKRKC